MEPKKTQEGVVDSEESNFESSEADLFLDDDEGYLGDEEYDEGFYGFSMKT
jgi:hypothetical protein